MNWRSTCIAIFSGVLLAILCYHTLDGWVNLIPWSIIALLAGYLSTGKKQAIIQGILFGYFLFLTFILISYKGKPDATSILKIVLFSIAFSLIGAVAGAIGALAGYLIRQKISLK